MRLLISLITLSILSACAISNKASLIELQTLSGSVTGQPDQDWPLDTELHLFLKGITGERSEGDIISSQHILLNKGVQAIPFTIKYKSSDIQKNAAYAVQACITISGDVALVSAADVPVLTQEHKNNPVIRMAAIQTDGGIGGLFIDAKTTLQRGIQTTLIDICRQKPVDYDHFTSTRASLILPPNLLEGPHHKVLEQVDLRGPITFLLLIPTTANLLHKACRCLRN